MELQLPILENLGFLGFGEKPVCVYLRVVEGGELREISLCVYGLPCIYKGCRKGAGLEAWWLGSTLPRKPIRIIDAPPVAC